MTTERKATMADIELLPSGIRDSVLNYVEKGWPIGGFLSAVFSNNLMEAAGRADQINRARLADICTWIYNEAPASCWGSPEAVKAWQEQGGLVGGLQTLQGT